MRNKKKILVICQDYVGKSMAGPAIRSYEFSNSLSKKYKIVLLAPNDSDVKSTKFKIKKISRKVLRQEMQNAFAVISQKITPELSRLAKKYKVRMILDAYDPIAIESLEANSHEPANVRDTINKILLIEQSFSFIFADGIICASEKQRDYWIGVLSSMNRISPDIYDQDNGLRGLIDVVPFGLSSAKPSGINKSVLRKKFNLSKDDIVLIWGGGIWNWFDPLSLIEAVAETPKTLNIKLVFMGIDHPNKDIPRMPMVEKAISKSKALGLYNKSIFFNEGWVPYEERKGYLMDADAGVSMHFDHLETRFSFRTRMLDYIWAGLPIIATEGDSFAELIEAEGLGAVVRYTSSESIAGAITKLAKDKAFYRDAQNNLGRIKKSFYWQECVKPINRMIDNWESSAYPSKPKPSIAMGQLVGIYGARKILTKKFVKKYFGLSENKHRIVSAYTSQNFIRRKKIKKILKKSS